MLQQHKKSNQEENIQETVDSVQDYSEESCRMVTVSPREQVQSGTRGLGVRGLLGENRSENTWYSGDCGYLRTKQRQKRQGRENQSEMTEIRKQLVKNTWKVSSRMPLLFLA